MTWSGKRRAVRLTPRALPVQVPDVPQTRQAPLTAAQLTRARLRSALEFVQDVVHDGDLLAPAARVQVLAAHTALADALALVSTQED